MHNLKDCDCSACRRYRKHKATNKLAAKIAMFGGTVAPGNFFADWAENCEKPIELKRMVTSRQAVDDIKPLELGLMVPCRKCETCLQYRQMMWRERAIYEIGKANRTWIVCLTFSPAHLALILLEAKSGSERDVEMAAYKHVQLFYKRLRKKAVFRYLAVFERGDKNDRAHYHLLLHEIDHNSIRKAFIESGWPSIKHARLVRSDVADGAATYVTKYATKSLSVKPRASFGYGKNLFPVETFVPWKESFYGVKFTNFGEKKDDAPEKNERSECGI